jgi:hypothetical protein
MQPRFHALVLVFAASCGGGSSPVGSGPQLATKVVELEITQDDGSITIDRLDLAYAGDRLAEMKQFRNGTSAGMSRFTYGADGIAAIDYIDGEGDRATEKMTYRDHALVTDRFEVAGVMTWVNEISYGASGLPTKLSGKTTQANGTVSTDVARLEYDGDRTAMFVFESDGDTKTTELDYTDDGLLDRTTTFSSTEVVTNEFVYSPEGSLVGVNGSKVTSQITYENGRVAEVRSVRSEGGTVTYRYKYGTGNIASVSFAPSVSFGRFFDLAGVSHGVMSTRHDFLESFMPADIPAIAQ